ncbi:MAG: hypothetical protein JWN40_5303 [Phycisphaerales bacterium]|nr:hypothetical protein [Phycisphaerales bacterium]
MLEQLRRLLESSTGKLIAVIAAVLLLAISGFVGYANLKSDTPSSAFQTMFICTETGKPFEHTNKIGETQPILSPHSGKKTGVPAEACYWTADGGTKKSPTWVLLNELAGKSGPTFCTDCGRLVVGHNPSPAAGAKLPPKQDEYSPPTKRARSKEQPKDRAE